MWNVQHLESPALIKPHLKICRVFENNNETKQRFREHDLLGKFVDEECLV